MVGANLWILKQNKKLFFKKENDGFARNCLYAQ